MRSTWRSMRIEHTAGPGLVSARDQGQPERIDRSSRRRGPQLPCHASYANGKTTDWSKAVLGRRPETHSRSTRTASRA
jgi:hypothetical protein